MENEQNQDTNEIISTRVFDTNIEKLFNAWTNPDLLAKWWGPKGFTNTFYTFDLKPGGLWKFVMHGPNGVDYQNESVFEEITPFSQIILNHISKPQFKVIADFEEQSGKTKLIFRMVFNSVKECQSLKAFIVDANEENFDRLETVVASQA